MPKALRHWLLAAALGIAVSETVLASPDANTNGVEVVVQVLQASTQGGAPSDRSSLMWMKQQLGNQGLRYKTLRRITEHHLILQPGNAVELRLPNGRTEVLQLEGVSTSGAQVRIGPRNRDVVYTINDENPVFLDAGPHEHGRILLFVSSATDFQTHQRMNGAPDAGR
jgi:hypothetical protein